MSAHALPPDTPAAEAIPQLMEAHGGKIYGLALRLCSGPSEAEDLVQETFLRAFEGWEGFEGRSEPSTWLYTIASRLCRRLQRKRSGEPERMESLAELLPSADESVPAPPDAHDPEAEQMHREAQEAVEGVIATLPMDFRLPLVLKDIAELSLSQIATVLGVKEATVKTRVHRARLRLRQALAERMHEHQLGRLVTPRELPHSRQVCLDLLHAKQEALDRGVALPVPASELCARCSALFSSLDMTRDVCHELGRGALPEALRRLLEERLATASANSDRK